MNGCSRTYSAPPEPQMETHHVLHVRCLHRLAVPTAQLADLENANWLRLLLASVSHRAADHRSLGYITACCYADSLFQGFFFHFCQSPPSNAMLIRGE